MLSVLSDSKNSELRRAIGMNGTRLNSIFPLVSGKIEPSVFISHFDFKINWSNEQSESNWRFLSVNSMRNGRISQLKAPTIEYCEKALALVLFWSVYVLDCSILWILLIRFRWICLLQSIENGLGIDKTCSCDAFLDYKSPLHLFRRF